MVSVGGQQEHCCRGDEEEGAVRGRGVGMVVAAEEGQLAGAEGAEGAEAPVRGRGVGMVAG